MALFSRKPKPVEPTSAKSKKAPTKKSAVLANAEAGEAKAAPVTAIVNRSRNSGALIVPRLSEKGNLLNRLNKYVFKIEGKMNKLELRKAIESTHGAKVAQINMITVKGKYRRYGKAFGRTSDFKKAVITLTPDSKKIEVES